MVNFLVDKSFQGLQPFEEDDPHLEKMSVKLFVDLMNQFYHIGWMKGTGGAMGAILGKHFMISPSALQKERLSQSDIFVFNLETHQLDERPKNPTIGVSSCAPLFSYIVQTTGSKCIIHIHSLNSNLITQLIKGEVFSMSHQEYIKGIYDPFTGKNMRYDETLVIPIIDNMPTEDLLLPGLQGLLMQYPRSIAALVRNHGLFVWGMTWQAAKIHTECIEYLLKLGIKMLEKGLPLVQEEKNNVKQTESSYQLNFDDSI